MSLGPFWFKDQYKNLSIEELTSKLQEKQEYQFSEEFAQECKQEREFVKSKKGFGYDNSIYTNLMSEIECIQMLIREHNQKREYSQDEIKNLFDRKMTKSEKIMLKKLDKKKLKRAMSTNYLVKYFEEIGYCFINYGWNDSAEVRTYVLRAVETSVQANRILEK